MSWRAGKRGGLTLIEVVASLALLGTLLTSLMIAHGRHQKQARLAEKRILALEAADQLLTQWTTRWEPLRHGQRGSLATVPPLIWQLRALDVPESRKFGGQVLRLELFDMAAVPGDAPRRPLAWVDVLSTEISLVRDPVTEDGP